MFNLLIFFATAVFLIYFWFRKKYTYWRDLGFRYIEPSFPFGNIKSMGFSKHTSEIFKQFYDLKKGQAPCIGFYMFSEPSLIAIDPEFIKNILVRDFDYFHDRGIFVNLKDDPLSGHLFSLEGVEWKNLRAKLTPTFTSGKMKMMFDKVNIIGDEMVKFLNASKTRSTDHEMKEILTAFTTDVIGNIAFGIETHCINNPNSEFRKYGKAMMDPSSMEVLKNLFINVFPNMARKLHMTAASPKVIEFFMNIVEENFKYRTENKVVRNDFFQLLLQIRESNEEFSIPEIAAQCFVFFLAGSETSSSSMTFTLLEMAKNLEIQQKLREEMQATIKKYDGKITYEGVAEMKYLDKVFCEILRKYPIVDLQLRKCDKDYRIPDTNLIVAKGITVLIPTYALHHDPEYFPNPNTFDPERFSEANIQSRHPFCYLPFGEGPRMCIGMRFAFMQTKIGLIKLLTNFRFLLNGKSPVPIEFVPTAPFLTAKGGMNLTVQKL